MTQSTTAAQPLDLDALDKLERAASPGPWIDGRHTVYQDDSVGGEEICKRMSLEDSAFIAAARNALPVLIAHVRAAQTESATGTIGTHNDIEQRLRRLATDGDIFRVKAVDASVLTEAANTIADLRAQLAAKDQDDAFRDAVAYGTGILKDGKHIPYADLYATPASAQPAEATSLLERLRENNPEFVAHLERSSSEVATWPKWKTGMWPTTSAQPDRGATVAPSDAKGKAEAANAGGLTDEQIMRIAGDVRQHNAGSWPGDVTFARAVLAAQSPATSAADAKDAARWRLICGLLSRRSLDYYALEGESEESITKWADAAMAAAPSTSVGHEGAGLMKSVFIVEECHRYEEPRAFHAFATSEEAQEFVQKCEKAIGNSPNPSNGNVSSDLPACWYSYTEIPFGVNTAPSSEKGDAK